MCDFMATALFLAEQAYNQGEVPVGAIVVHDGQIIARAHNLVRSTCDPTAHAEILAVRAACQFLKTSYLSHCHLYVTLEPCAMCTAAISHAHISRLYYGAYDPKEGAVDHGPRLFQSACCHHKPEVISGLQEQDAAKILRRFFVQLRR